MGKISIGKMELEANSFKVLGNCLLVNGKTIQLCEGPGKIQIRGTEVVVDNFKSNTDVLLEGNVARVVCEKYLIVVGKVFKFFVEGRNYFFNNTASEEYRLIKKSLTTKVPVEEGKRNIVKISGIFSNIEIVQQGCVSVEVWLKGTAIYAKNGASLVVKGDVSSARVGQAMYVSKK